MTEQPFSIDPTEVFDAEEISQMKTQHEMETLLRIHREKNKPETHPDFDGKNCIDCDSEIQDGRLKLGKIRCIFCQQKKERHGQVYAGAVG
jgi:RNA polymerase-binding transcription factor DksA